MPDRARTENYYRYSNEFKATAVRLSELAGVEVQDVAASLYIHPFTLSRWRKQAREGQIVTKGVEVDKQVAAELKELRKMNKSYERLQIEHDLLKKAPSSLPNEERRHTVQTACRNSKSDSAYGVCRSSKRSYTIHLLMLGSIP